MNSKNHSEMITVSSVFLTAITATWHAKKNGKKIIYYFGPSEKSKWLFHRRGTNSALIRRWKKRFYEQGEIIVTPTHYFKELLEGCGIEKQIYIVPQGVDTSYFTPDESFGRMQHRKTVLFLDDLSDRKITKTYLKIAGECPEILFLWMRNRAECSAVGAARSRSYESAENIQSIDGSGASERKDAYQRCDLLLSIAESETDERSVLEAMACGAAVAVSDSAVFDGALQGRNAVYLIQQKEAFSESIRELLQSDLRMMRENARKFAKERDYTQIRKLMRQIYDIENLEDDGNYFTTL
ncbi:MAG: glycosyltransferase family 4 protein [Eubacteriales bacterium]|nr:glycosyltransferase family 4 protein [Eubacteriales bacterium]